MWKLVVKKRFSSSFTSKEECNNSKENESKSDPIAGFFSIL